MLFKKKKVDTRRRAYDLVSGDRIFVFGRLMVIDRIEFDPKLDENKMYLIFHLLDFWNPISEPYMDMNIQMDSLVDIAPS